MNSNQNNSTQNNQLTRRSLIRNAAKSLLGVSAVSALPGIGLAGTGMGGQSNFASNMTGKGKAKSVIYIYLTGGLSQIDSFDPKPGTEQQGPVESLSTNADDMQVTQYFPLMAKQMDKVCAVRSVTSTQGAHLQGIYYMRTSYEMNQTIRHPGMGAWGSHFLGPGETALPQNVKIGGSITGFWGGFLDPKHAAFPVANPTLGIQNGELPESISGARFERRLQRLRAMNAKYVKGTPSDATNAHVQLFDEAVKLMKSAELEGFDLSRESKQKRESYGDNTLGQGCLLARRLVERGVRFVEVNDRGWDMHIRNFDKMCEKGPVLDQALSTLLADLSESGMLDETLVVVATEFGRTPTIDGANMGRDHYPQAFTCLLAGGGVVGGQAYGATSKDGSKIIQNKVTIPDFNATIGYALGLPIDQKVISPTKRPFTVANKGTPITTIFG